MDTTINNRITGVYRLVYEVSNSAGDTVKIPVDVEIYEPIRNEVQLNLSSYLVYYEGQAIDYLSYLTSIITNNTEYFFEGVEPVKNENVALGQTPIPLRRVTVESEVNPNKPGVYPVYFYYENYGTVRSEGIEVMYVVVE